MKHPGSGNNSQGHSVEVALQAAEDAIEDIEVMQSAMTRMNDRQRKLFVALARGKDEVEAALESGYYESWVCGIVKVLDLDEEYQTKTKRTIDAVKVTPKNLYLLSQGSYDRLMSICKNRVAKQTANDDYKDHIIPIQEFFQLLAPDAMAVIGDLAFDESVKDETRLKASQDILDRAGYKEKAGGGSDNPFMVNIVLPGAGGPTVEVVHAQ